MTEVKNPMVRNVADRAVRARDQWNAVPVKVRRLAFFAVTVVVFSALWFGFMPDAAIELVETWQNVDTAGRTRLVVYGLGVLVLGRYIGQFAVNATRPEAVCACHRDRTGGDQ